MSGPVRFLLDGRSRSLDRIDPTLTVLQWLRGSERRCGTKEGCAEGDCGACTVVLGELDGRGAVRLRAVNACLLFVPALDGKALFTVESLAAGSRARGPGGPAREAPLHPVQEALVECHGSQCGFCTPGFVMSMFALYEEGAASPTRRQIDDALAGNLCRCTGYRPIVEAVRRACAAGARDGAAARADLAGTLRAIARTDTLALEHDGKRYWAPSTLDALADLCAAHPDAILLAGGTDVGLWVTKQHRRLDAVIAVGGVRELREVRERDGVLELGAGATYADVAAPLGALHPDLGELVRRIGSTQIRNLGTVGGNLANASPIGDMPPALLALDATVVLRRGAERRELPLDQLFVGYRKTALRPGELLERIRVPRLDPRRAFRAYKVSKRFDQDISAVCGAFAVTVEDGRVRDARVAFGGMAAVPLRARATEAALAGRPWSAATVEAAVQALAAELTPISDQRASAAYRRLVAGNLLRKFHLETSAAPPRTRVLAEETP